MAGDNDVLIKADFDSGDANAGVGDLLGRFQALGDAAGEISDAYQELGLEDAFADGIQMTDLFAASLQIGLNLIKETSSALEDMTAAWDKAGNTIAKYYDQKEKGAGKAQKDQLRDSGLPADVEAAMMEQGAMSQGFAAAGTWTRRFQNIGSGISDFVGGDDSNADALREGKKIASRQRDIDQNNEDEQARRDFATKAQMHGFKQEQDEYKKWQQEQHDIDEKEAKDADARDVAMGRAALDRVMELHRAEEAQDKRKENQENQQKRRAIGRDGAESPDAEAQFRGGIVGFDSIFSAAATAAGGSKTDPVAERKRIQAEEKAHRDEIREKQERFDKDLFDQREAREDARIAELKKGLGLG